MLENGFPQRVGSFFSTALFSLNATRPGSVELVAMQPSPSAWKSAAAARAHDVYYDALIRVGVPVVSLS